MSLDNPRFSRESTLSEYQKAAPEQKRAFLQNIIRSAESRLFPDSWTKAAYNILSGKIHAGNNNFLERQKEYEQNFRPLLTAQSLPKKFPYWQKNRVKSQTQPYNKWLYDRFQGYRTQNTALIHFLATKELQKITAPVLTKKNQSENIKINSFSGRSDLKIKIQKERRALSLRKQVFQDAEGGDYTFVPEPGTPLHQSVTLGQLFPNHARLDLVIGHPRRGRRQQLKVGNTITAVQKNSRFYPESAASYGRLPLEIWHGDRVILPDTGYRSRDASASTEDNPDRRDTAPHNTTPPVDIPKIKGGANLRKQISQLPTDNVLPKVPQMKIRPTPTNGVHAINPEAVSRSGGELDLDSNGCAQFAFRLLGKVHGRELAKRGVFADAWTMLHSIRAKERQDKVPADSYVQVAGDIHLDHDHYYDRRRHEMKITPSLLQDDDYLDDFVRLYQAGQKTVRAKNIAFITYYFHNSPNMALARKDTKKLLKKGAPLKEAIPTTHIEVLTAETETDFLNKEFLHELKSTTTNKGNYFDLLVQTYVKHYLKQQKNLPIEKTASSYRLLALKKLGMFLRCGVSLFLKDQTGKKRPIIMKQDESGNFKLLDKKNGTEILFDKNKPETLVFSDLKSRTGEDTNALLKNFLLFDFRGQKTDRETNNLLPGKILQLTNLKWPQSKNLKEAEMNRLINLYTSIPSAPDEDSFKNLNEIYSNYRITPRDLPYYHAALRRVGVNPDHIVKDSPIPIFDLAKVKILFFQEAAKTNKSALQEWKSLNDKLAAVNDPAEKTRLEQARADLIDKHTLPYLQRQLIGAEAAAVQTLFSPAGLNNLQRQIANIDSLISKTDQQLRDLHSSRPRKFAAIRKALTYKRAISARRDYLREEEQKLTAILNDYLILSVQPGLNSRGLLKNILAATPQLNSLKLLPEEKRFILDYVDRVNQNIDLRLVARGGKQAYRDWQAGALIFVKKKALIEIAAIIKNYRETRLANSQLPDKISCGEYKDEKKKGQFIISTVPPAVKTAIAQAANGDALLSKLLLLTWAREQGRSGSHSSWFTRKRWKSLVNLFKANNSFGVFQVRPIIFSHLVKKGDKTVRELKPGYAKLFGVRDYSELVQKLKTDIPFNTRVAAHLLTENAALIRNQLRVLKVDDQVAPDSELGATLVLSAFNRGTRIIPASIINWRLEKLRKIFPYVSATPHLDGGHQPWQLFLKKYLPPKTKPAALTTTYKIYRFALALKEKHPGFSTLSEEQIAADALLLKSSPLRFLKTKLYADFVKFAAEPRHYVNKKPTERAFRLDQSIFSFQELYEKGALPELNYGFLVTNNDQYKKLALNLTPVADLLKLPPRRKTQPVAGVASQES